MIARPRSRTRVLADGREICRGAAYERRRQQILKRDGRLCVRCGSGYGVQVHHLRKRSVDRDDRPTNLITLCDACHKAAHQ